MSDFPLTRWSLVVRAGDVDPAVKAVALGEVLRTYLPALRSHLVLRKRLASDRADDLLQQFCSDKVLALDLIARAERERGRFRTFLLTSLDRFYLNVREADHARKRRSANGPDADLDSAAGHVDDAPSPGEAFDLAWARQVLDQAISRTREECQADGRSDVWAVFEGRLLGPILEGSEPVPYEDLVARFGLTSVQRANNLLVTGKRMYARHLAAVVSEYEPQESVEAEIDDLRQLLARTRG